LHKGLKGILFSLLIFTSFISSVYSQTNTLVIDNFGDHKLPGWVWGGNLSMKYSHSYDNPENGYGIITSNTIVPQNTFVGLIRKEQKFQVVENNILSVMLQGVSNDLTATIQILFDRNGDGKYDENLDTRLESKPISLNYSGWKEIHINIDENELKVVSRLVGEDFSILENEAYGFQISYQTGKDFKTGKIETGIALITERANKEEKKENAVIDDNSGESYFHLKNYPNPFNPETTISYTLKQSTNVRITIYDRLGREVTTILDAQQSEGDHTIVFNGSNLPSGIYFYRLKTPEKTEVKKMVLAK
jgi:hypothetical protein